MGTDLGCVCLYPDACPHDQLKNRQKTLIKFGSLLTYLYLCAQNVFSAKNISRKNVFSVENE